MTPQTERRAFRLHPAVLNTIIREQAGTLTKAVAELVMNAVDAGASRIEITRILPPDGIGGRDSVSDSSSHGSFTIVDDGRGFASRTEIDTFFETFGTPHEPDDARYGRFRIGRGQIMSYGKSTWRSGDFEMLVDLKDASTDFGYDLKLHTTKVAGCSILVDLYAEHDRSIFEITGLAAQGHSIGSHDDYCYYYMSPFQEAVRYVPVPVVVDGVTISSNPATCQWDHEDAHGWYRFDPRADVMKIYNLGIHVTSLATSYFGSGGVMVSKNALRLNAARNAIIKDSVWAQMGSSVNALFATRLDARKKLTPSSKQKLLRELVFSDLPVPPKALAKLRFIEDVFGNDRGAEFLFPKNRTFTYYDGIHRMIAERVQNQGIAVVVVPELMAAVSADMGAINAAAVIDRLRERTAHALPGIDTHQPGDTRWLNFDALVRQFSDTMTILNDADLDPRALAVLSALRTMNSAVADRFNEPPRALCAGLSDTSEAWTDGQAYIAIHQDRLLLAAGRSRTQRTSRPRADGLYRFTQLAGLFTLLAHEYSHAESTTGDHHHDDAFYRRFHEGVMHPRFGRLIDHALRTYLTELCKRKLHPSTETRYEVDWYAAVSDRLPRWKKATEPADLEPPQPDNAALLAIRDAL